MNRSSLFKRKGKSVVSGKIVTDKHFDLGRVIGGTREPSFPLKSGLRGKDRDPGIKVKIGTMPSGMDQI